MTEARVAWIEAFTKAQGEFPAIGKDTRVNTGRYEYSYATLPDILEKVSAILRNYGLVVAQSVAGTAEVVEVETRIYHKEGHVERFGPLTLTAGRDAQAAGSAITYARRYALCAALGIAPDEDDDGTRASQSESEAIAAWRRLWEDAKVLKSWNDEERMAAIKAAMKLLKIEEVTDRDKAEAILAHVTAEYAKRPTETQEALPVE